MNDENSILIPILNDDVTIFSVVVPKDFADEVEFAAMKMVDRFDSHPAGQQMDPNNKMAQARSFLVQNSMHLFLRDYEGEDYTPPDLG